MADRHSNPNSARVASATTLLAGLWLFLTPIFYGAYDNGNKYNGFTVGGLIVVFSAIRLFSRRADSAALSWITVVFGVWTMLSPWIFRFGVEPRTWNNIAIGVVVTVLSVISARATPLQPVHPGPARVP